MKRVLSFVLAVMAILALAVPALALGSMTNPVEIIDSVTPTPSPEPTTEPTASPEPSVEPAVTPEPAAPTEVIRGEIVETEPLPTAEPEETPVRVLPTEEPHTIEELIETWGINDPEVPMAAFNGTPGAAWALVNLICTVLSIGFGAAATGEAAKINRRKKVLPSGLTLIRKEKTRSVGGAEVKETQVVQKSKLWKSGFYDLVTSVGSVIAFILTEDIWLPMCLTDKWTPLMVGILGACLAVYGVTVGGKKLKPEEIEQLLAVGSAKQ